MAANPEASLTTSLSRVIDLLVPRNKPPEGEEQEPELPISFWTRATGAIGSIPEALGRYYDARVTIDAGIYRRATVVAGETEEDLEPVSPDQLIGYTAHVERVLIDLELVSRCYPYDAVWGLIPNVAREQRGEEFGTEVGEIYRKFQMARAEKYFGVKFSDLAQEK